MSIRNEQHRAAVWHWCGGCHTPIRPGELYQVYVGVLIAPGMDGPFHYDKLCAGCVPGFFADRYTTFRAPEK